jgi:hypothetical protein
MKGGHGRRRKSPSHLIGNSAVLSRTCTLGAAGERVNGP